ncbi:TPA: packaged DNA stabilization protein [Enterobacter roggenkampii]
MLPLNNSHLSELYRAEVLLTRLGSVLQRLELKHLSQFDTLRTMIRSNAERLEMDTSISCQYEEQQEHLLYTPLFKADNARVFDFELESSNGVSQFAERMFISATTDGINYGREQMIPWNAPFRYDQRAIWKRLGRIRKNIGFKIRIITSSPVTLSGCQVRIE